MNLVLNNMNKEDKELLLKDLCARLPYGVKIQVPYEDGSGYFDETVWEVNNDGPFHVNGWGIEYEYVKPYLFPLSSMTEEQEREYNTLRDFVYTHHYEYEDIVEDMELYDNWMYIDYLNAHHFDFRGLIEKGLAIDATNLNIY